MTFKTNMQSDLDNVMLNTDEFAESITINPFDGSGAITADVNWRDTGVQERPYRNDLREVKTATVTASKTDYTSPDTRDTVTRDSVTWAVFEIIGETDEDVVFEVITVSERYIGGQRLRG